MKNKLKEAAMNYACTVSTSLDDYSVVKMISDAFLIGARWVINDLLLEDKNGTKYLSNEDASILEDSEPSVMYVTPEEYQNIVKAITDYINRKE